MNGYALFLKRHALRVYHSAWNRGFQKKIALANSFCRLVTPWRSVLVCEWIRGSPTLSNAGWVMCILYQWTGHPHKGKGRSLQIAPSRKPDPPGHSRAGWSSFSAWVFGASAPCSGCPLALPERCAVSGYEQSGWPCANWWCSNRSASRFRLLSMCELASNFSLDKFLYIDLWVMYQDHVSRLSARVSPFPALSAQLWIPVAFRLAAFASWSFPFPLRSSAFLAAGLLRISTTPETSLGFPRSARVRCNRGGCLLYCGDGCPQSR